MNKICTSLEQSKKLVELGIDVNTADMYYQYYKSYSPSEGITEGHCDIPVIGSWKEHHISIPDPVMPNADFPAWSLAALLELMPFHIIENGERYGFDQWKGFNSQGETYCFKYKSNIGKCLYETIHWNNSLNAAFEMVCWLKENRKL